jgi:hypothetical protein
MTITGQVQAPLSAGELDVGILWLRSTQDPIQVVVNCHIELSAEAPSSCVAACGVPSCDDLERLRTWQECSSSCDGPTGVSSLTAKLDTDTQVAGAVGQRVHVEGEFPAQFRLELLQPPPDDVLIHARTGESVALGLFVALDPAGAPFVLDGDAPGLPPWIQGASETHLLLFAHESVPRDSDLGTILGFGVAPGFQLLEVTRDPFASSGEAANFLPVPASEATHVQLRVDDPASLRWPLACPDVDAPCSFSAAFE